MKARVRALIAAAVFGLCTHTVVPAEATETTSCPGVEISVRNADASLAGKVCAAAERATALLGDCGIRQTRPVTVEIVEMFPDSHGPCVASFDCGEDILQILPPDRLADPSIVAGAFAEVPPEVFFDSLIVHELTHAFLHHTDPSIPLRTAHEYLAYAFQLDSLPEEHRNTILDARTSPEPVTSSMVVNPAILLFAPQIFAANAWLYFTGVGERCNSVDRIRSGELLFSFGALWP